MKIKFWGVRGSHPICGKKFLNYGGNSTCLSVEVEDKLFIIDAGTGIINCDNENNNKYDEFNLLFTHMHIDHLQGFMFFKPLYSKSKTVNLYGPMLLNQSYFDSIKGLMSNNLFPAGIDSMNGIKSVTVLKQTDKLEFKLKNGLLVIETKFLDVHPLGGVYVYKFIYNNKSFVFATDVEGKKEGLRELIEFSEGVDLLIHDAQYEDKEYEKKKGWGHSTAGMAIRNAELANVKTLCLTHYNPDDSDEYLDNKLVKLKKIYSNLIFAKDGLEIIL